MSDYDYEEFKFQIEDEERRLGRDLTSEEFQDLFDWLFGDSVYGANS